MSEDLKTRAPNVRAMPAWALMAGIASLGAIAIEAMHFGPALIVVILGGAVLLVGAWRCEVLNQDGSASWPIRAAASLSHLFRAFIGFWSLVFLVLSFVIGIGPAIFSGPSVLGILAGLAVGSGLVAFGLAGHLGWRPRKSAEKRRLALRRPHVYFALLVTGLVAMLALLLSPPFLNTEEIDRSEVRDTVNRVRTITEQFYRDENRLPDELDAAELTRQTEMLYDVSVIGPGVFRIGVNTREKQRAFLYLIARDDGKSRSTLSYECLHDAPALTSTDRLAGDLKCHRSPGLDSRKYASQRSVIAGSAVAAGRLAPVIKVYFELGRWQARHMRAAPRRAGVPPKRNDLPAVKAALMAGMSGIQPIAVEVVAYADPSGSERRNLKLSERRAESIRTLLKQLGVRGTIISTRGGGTKSIPPDCHTQEQTPGDCTSLSRRAEINIRY
ncbi:MAG TPA: OmpA family protein [Rhodocyclaceae bacterium]|nr:OmpA family protein [Rhodocyclaceae bacterium]